MIFKYRNSVEPEVHSKIERARVWLLKVLDSWEFKEKASRFEETTEFLKNIKGFSVSIKQGGTPKKKPFSYLNQTVSVDPSIMLDYPDKKVAGFLAHEIAHEWFDHGAGEFGGFMQFLTDGIPKMDPNPTKSEKCLLWLKWGFIKIMHLLAWITGYPLLPFAFLLKYGFGVKNIYLLNDTSDGDFGGFGWKRKKLSTVIGKFPKWLQKFILAFLWYNRNSVWNLKLMTAPKYNGEFIICEVVKNEVKTPLWWVNQFQRGTNHTYYRIEGSLYFRYSHSNNLFNIHCGMTGTRYSFKLRRTR